MRTASIVLGISAMYLCIVTLTDVSLSGYWIDLITALLIAIVSISILMFLKAKAKLISLIGFLALVVAFAAVISINSQMKARVFWDSINNTSFFNVKVEDRHFNAYFLPVGAYSGGEGIFWISETSSVLPIFEHEVYRDKSVLWDFGLEEFDGQVVDQKEIVKKYIADYINSPEN